MSDLRQAAQQALEALDECLYWYQARDKNEVPFPADMQNPEIKQSIKAILALRAALAEPEQPYDQTALDLCKVCGWRTLIPSDACLNCERSKQSEQEPIGHADFGINNIYIFSALEPRVVPDGRTPLYTAPTPRKPLTDQEIDALDNLPSYPSDAEVIAFVRRIEQAHNIK